LRPSDLEGLKALLSPLEAAGVLVSRTREDLRALLPHFTVLEREARAMGCVLLLPLGAAPVDGRSVAEIGAFCVDPAFRGSGRGDSLLDYAEQEARAQGVQRLVLLTTRTADWFMARDFRLAGPAWSSELLPADRRARVDPSRNSQLYVKELVPLADLDSDDPAQRRINTEPGKRIGF
jgi:amino-acid N-acetyltransferase